MKYLLVTLVFWTALHSAEITWQQCMRDLMVLKESGASMEVIDKGLRECARIERESK